MEISTKVILSIVAALFFIFALNWALANAYSGVGFYIYAFANGILFIISILFAYKAYKNKNKS